MQFKVCPMIRICPSDVLVNMWEEIPKNFISTKNEPNCPFCLLAVSQIYNVVRSNKTEVLYSLLFIILTIFMLNLIIHSIRYNNINVIG